jgi:predicted acylesterase/phospholipase RssA
VGVAVPLAIAWSLNQVGADGQALVITLSRVYFAMAILLLAFYVLRRSLFSISRDYMIAERLDEVPKAHRRRARALLLSAFVLLVAFVAVPVYLPQWLGAPAIAVLGVTGIALFGTAILTYVPMSKGGPAATLTALLLAVLFGFWNHNHPIRLADEAGGKAMAALARPAPAERFAAMAQSAGGAETVVFVIAAGGGIRAAYWTASVLAALEDELGETFSKRLFAISGVSGGSVGAAAYVTLKRAQLEAGPDASLLAPVRTVLGNDFLSPVVAGLLFPDLAQRFIPFPVTLADRQRFLERSFELAFQGDARRLFAGPFQNLYAGAAGDRLPSLLLNTTVVETGQRAVLSNLDVGGLPGVVDLFDDRYQLAAIRTSAAAGASARFTYVSPAGRVDIAGDDSVRLVDGGYFENSGAATMGDLIALLDDRIGDSDRKFRPVLIVINNDPTSVGLCRRDNSGSDTLKGGRFNAAVSEVAAPIRALFETRGARQQIAEVKAARLVEAMGGGVVQMPLAAVLDVQLETARAQAAEPLSQEAIAKIKEKYLEPPLGWSMSEEVRKGMDQTLDDRAGGLAEQFQYLTTALGGGTIPACEPM